MKFTVQRTPGWRSRIHAMSRYERVACRRTHGRSTSPLVASRYGGWCMCQRKASRTFCTARVLRGGRGAT
ncbi:MAG: hypothetical protein QM704_05795 [Anaeromyxobacteraceae bacterium]